MFANRGDSRLFRTFVHREHGALGGKYFGGSTGMKRDKRHGGASASDIRNSDNFPAVSEMFP
jgi:hypothetical protein